MLNWTGNTDQGLNMRKILLTILALLILVAGGSALWVSVKGKEVLRTSVETYGPRVMGAQVTLNDLSLSPFSGKAGMNGLTIGNPQGFSDANALSFDDFKIHLKPLSVLSDVIVVDTIRIDAPAIRIEPGKGTLNLQVLQKNIENFIGPQTTDPEQEKAVKIKDFYLTKAQISIGGGAIGFSDQTLTLADIHLQNIGGKDGIPPADAARLVFDALMPQVQKALSSKIGQQLLSQAKDRLGNVESEIRDRIDAEKGKIQEKIQEQTEKLPGGLQEKADDALKSGLGGVLKKKKDKINDDRSDKN